MKRTPRFFTDADGSAVAAACLANGKGEAMFDAVDFAALTEAGISSNLKLNNNGSPACSYVRAKLLGGDTVSVARFIARAGRGQIVRYRDGNRMNLRSSNLELSAGPATMDCRFITKTSGELY